MSEMREEVKSLLDRLPNDATIEDLQYYLYIIDKVEKGLASIKEDGGLSQEQVEAKFIRR